MNTILDTQEFRCWLKKLKDSRGKASILRRIERVQAGNFGDHKGVGGGVSEMRIPVGPGYRLYYTQIGDRVYLLLAGGDKSSQDRDIERAQAMVLALNG